MPVVGTIATIAKQIPVSRGGTDAAQAFSAAVAAVEDGEAVAFYPVGTITRDPDPVAERGKTGAARVALATGCPVIPIGHWGVQELLPPYGKPDLFPLRPSRSRPVTPSTSTTCRESRSRTRCCTRRPTASWLRSPGWWRPAGREGTRRAFRPAQGRDRGHGQPARQEEALMTRVAVFGAGSWGTAFSIVLADAGHDVRIWGRREEVCAAINADHVNHEYLPELELSPRISASHDPDESPRRRVVVLPYPRRRCGRTSPTGRRRCPARSRSCR